MYMSILPYFGSREISGVYYSYPTYFLFLALGNENIETGQCSLKYILT